MERFRKGARRKRSRVSPTPPVAADVEVPARRRVEDKLRIHSFSLHVQARVIRVQRIEVGDATLPFQAAVAFEKLITVTREGIGDCILAYPRES